MLLHFPLSMLDTAIAHDLTAWAGFFSVEAGTSGALTGLLFVAMSINLTQIISSRRLTARAAKALSTLLGVLFATTLCLVPGQSVSLLGLELALLGFLFWILITWTQWISSYDNIYISPPQKVFLFFLAQGSILPMIVAGISLAAHTGAGLFWLVPGTLVSFIAGFIDAWVLLIEIQR